MATSLWGLRQTEVEEQQDREARSKLIGAAAMEERNSFKDKSADEIANVDDGVELSDADEIADLDGGVELARFVLERQPAV